MDADVKLPRDSRQSGDGIRGGSDGSDKIVPFRDHRGEPARTEPALRAARPAPPVEAPPPPAPAKAAPAAAPPPPVQRQRKERHGSKWARSPVVVFFSGVFTFLVLVLAGLGAALYFGMIAFTERGPLAEEKMVFISKDSKLDQIGQQLQREGVISNGWLFAFGTQIYQADGKLKWGEYAFKPGVTMAQVLNQLTQGRVVQHAVTVPEGWTSEQIVQKLNEQPLLAGRIASVPDEGSLYPDTYNFTRGTTREDLLQRMRRTQDRIVKEVWAKRREDVPVANPRELVVLASIVEKETGRPEERDRVAAVFINRLRKGMRLESDPTILYGLHGGKAWTQARTILKSELQAVNPYNTYKITGLPPGPIANPGRAALEAVVNPARTTDLFFVADGTGGHAFSETLDDHNRNVAKWRQVEQARRDKAGEPALESLPEATPAAGTPPARTPQAVRPQQRRTP